MTDLNFKHVLEELEDIHEAMPDLRFGQVIQESLDRKKGRSNIDLFKVSTKELLMAVREFKEYHASKRKVAVKKKEGVGLNVKEVK